MSTLHLTPTSSPLNLPHSLLLFRNKRITWFGICLRCNFRQFSHFHPIHNISLVCYKLHLIIKAIKANDCCNIVNYVINFPEPLSTPIPWAPNHPHIVWKTTQTWLLLLLPNQKCINFAMMITTFIAWNSTLNYKNHSNFPFFPALHYST